MGIENTQTLSMFQVDAFSAQLFGGNPAAVCPLNAPLSAEIMQAIAAENNLAETAFVRLDTHPFELRWFTPTTEVDLCGHATLATAHVLFNQGYITGDSVHFQTLRSGVLSVQREKQSSGYVMDFPADTLNPSSVLSSWHEAIGAPILEAAEGSSDLILRLDTPESVREASPDLSVLKRWPYRGVILTAKSSGTFDFVSRFFGPAVGVDEDPVTGSAHTSLAVFWAGKLKKSRMSAFQASSRGGNIVCELKGDRVLLSGEARLYLKGEIYVPHH
ncbi:MAG: PhzF family phenazine biosynthesis protein [Flavobacteriaceae bacterium]